jgi:DeoR/GlpR family transcriptional regulator of sugar metabolism
VIGIADGSKWHRTALLPFVAPDQVHAIVTDTGAPAEHVEAWQRRGVEIVRVDPVESARPALRRLL